MTSLTSTYDVVTGHPVFIDYKKTIKRVSFVSEKELKIGNISKIF